MVHWYISGLVFLFCFVCFFNENVLLPWGVTLLATRSGFCPPLQAPFAKLSSCLRGRTPPLLPTGPLWDVSQLRQRQWEAPEKARETKRFLIFGRQRGEIGGAEGCSVKLVRWLSSKAKESSHCRRSEPVLSSCLLTNMCSVASVCPHEINKCHKERFWYNHIARG